MTWLAEMLSRAGDRAGLTVCDRQGDGVMVAWADVVARAGGAARQLQSLGVRPGDKVAILLDSTVPSVVALVGTWLAGATVVSVPPPPRERVGGETAVYRSGFRSELAPPHCRLIVGDALLEAALGLPVVPTGSLDTGPARPAPVEPAQLALVQYTSGSTGAPKGVAVSGRALFGHLRVISEAIEMDPAHDVGVSWLPLYHDMGLVGCLLSGLAAGGSLVLTAPSSFVRDPSSWLRLCAQYRATLTAAPDFGYRLAAAVLQGAPRDPGDLGALRACLSGAERVHAATLESFTAATTPFGFDPGALLPVYGMAEATLAVTFPPLGRGFVCAPDGSTILGRPLDGLELRVDAPAGGPGRVLLRGEWLMDGYLQEGVLHDPRTEDGWLATNDVGELHDGELVVHGRLDEAVIHHGRNVFAEDVERLAQFAEELLVMGAAAFRSADGDSFGLALELAFPPTDDLTAAARAVQGVVTRALGVRVSPLLLLSPRALPRTTSGKVRRAECRRLQQEQGWPDGALLAQVG